MRLATFHVSSAECALPIDRLREIVEPPPITRVPGAPVALRGLANLRGRVIPVLDLAARLGLPPSPARRPCLLIAEVAAAGGPCALAVDGIRGIEEVPEERVMPPRADVLGAGDWLAGFVDTGERLVLLLDVDRLFDPEVVRAIRPPPARVEAARAGAEAVAGMASPPGAAGQSVPSPASSPSAGPVEGPAVHPERSDAAASASRRRKAPVPVSIPGSTATRTATSQEIPASAAIHLERSDAASPGRRAATSPEPAPVPPEQGHTATTPWRSREAPTSTAGVTVRPERGDAASSASWSRRAPDARSAARSEIATGAFHAGEASSVPAPGTARPEAPPPTAFRWRAVALAVAGLVFVAAGLAVILALTGGRDVRPARSGSPERAAGELRARAPQAAIASPVVTPAPSLAPSPPSVAAPAPSVAAPAPSIAPSPPSVAAPAPSVAAPPAPVTPPRAPDTAPLRTGDRYEVVGGDTLWSISRRMLGDPYAWPDIHAANREAVSDPDLIRPGQRLVVPARTPAPRAAP